MERTQLESAVAENSHLRGLFAVPLGGLMLLSALGNWEVGPLRETWVFVLCAALVALPCLALARYYNEHYGRVTPSDAPADACRPDRRRPACDHDRRLAAALPAAASSSLDPTDEPD